LGRTIDLCACFAGSYPCSSPRSRRARGEAPDFKRPQEEKKKKKKKKKKEKKGPSNAADSPARVISRFTATWLAGAISTLMNTVPEIFPSVNSVLDACACPWPSGPNHQQGSENLGRGSCGFQPALDFSDFANSAQHLVPAHTFSPFSRDSRGGSYSVLPQLNHFPGPIFFIGIVGSPAPPVPLKLLDANRFCFSVNLPIEETSRLRLSNCASHVCQTAVTLSPF